MSSMDFESLGDFCKAYEETGTGGKALPGSILMARLDGRAFHSLTKNVEKPFSSAFCEAMTVTTLGLTKEFKANFGYTQSDEISLAWALKTPESQFPFGGKFHKLNSILAGYCACKFNQVWNRLTGGRSEDFDKFALFDCRTWSVPTEEIATKTIIWRQWDAERNSINMVAHHVLGAKKLEGIGTNERLKMLEKKGVVWGNYESKFKAGTFIFPQSVQTKLTREELDKIPVEFRKENELVTRTLHGRFHVNLRSPLAFGGTAQDYLFGLK